MSKSLKFSPWFDGDTKPVNKGWYMCKGCFLGKDSSGFVWRKWTDDGWQWINHGGSLVLAGFGRNDKWRGITK